MCWILAFFSITLAVYAVQYRSGLYYLWGLRNNFRFYVVFFAAALFWTASEITDFWKTIEGLFWIDVAVSLIQYGFFGYEQDFLGGLFGIRSGVNGYTNLFFAIVVSHSLVCYLANKESALSSGCKCAAALIVAAMAEMKFFFVEFPVILALAVLFSRRTFREFWVVFSGFWAVFSGVWLLSALFPGWGDWFSLEGVWQVAADQKGYTSSGDLNRLTAISMINARFFGSFWQKLFGFGLGNCDMASYSFLTTPFSRDYQHLHYHWMSHAFLYLETGWVGLTFFFGFFLLVFCQAGRLERWCDGGGVVDCRVARIMAVVCAMTGIYNASLRSEPGYLAYLVLALPFAYGRDRHG